MKQFIYLITAIIFISINFCKAQEQDTVSKVTHEVKFDPSRNPETDLKQTISVAQKTDKRILLDVGGEWCIWCHRLDKFFIDNKDVNDFLQKNFVVMKVNFSPENKNEKFLSKYPKVPGYPHLFVLEKDGKFLHSQDTGKLEAGKGHDHDKVFAFLKEWAPVKNDLKKDK
ncbi:MAG: thioredoxin family protein [Ignavibacteriales bacterium]|nr:thioredoxin family protein [Ignavibacteriales bacterium]